MIVTKKHLPRRTFLRGALGAVVAMPFLDAMIPALAAQTCKRPFRFGAICAGSFAAVALDRRVSCR